MTITSERRGGRGGRRAGAGRPETARRLNLDAEHAQLLRDLTRAWRERQPQCRWTARLVAEHLIALAWLHETRDPHEPSVLDRPPRPEA